MSGDFAKALPFQLVPTLEDNGFHLTERLCVSVCVCARGALMHACVCVQVHACLCVCAYVCVCVCVCVYMCVSGQKYTENNPPVSYAR